MADQNMVDSVGATGPDNDKRNLENAFLQKLLDAHDNSRSATHQQSLAAGPMDIQPESTDANMADVGTETATQRIQQPPIAAQPSDASDKNPDGTYRFTAELKTFGHGPGVANPTKADYDTQALELSRSRETIHELKDLLAIREESIEGYKRFGDTQRKDGLAEARAKFTSAIGAKNEVIRKLEKQIKELQSPAGTPEAMPAQEAQLRGQLEGEIKKSAEKKAKEDAKDEYDRLAKKNADLQTKLTESSKKYLNQLAVSQKAEKDIQDWKDKYNRAKERTDSTATGIEKALKNKDDEHQAQLHEEFETQQRLQQTIDQLKHDNSEVTRRCDELARNNDELWKQHEDLKTAYEESENNVNQLKQEGQAEINRQVADKTAESRYKQDELQAELTNKSDEIEKLTKHAGSQEQRIKELEDQAERANDALQKQNPAGSNELSPEDQVQLNELMDHTRKELMKAQEQFSDEKAKLQAEVDDQRKQLEDLRLGNAGLTTMNNFYSTLVNDRVKERDTAYTQNEELRRQVQQLTKQQQADNEQIWDLNEQLKQQNEQLRQQNEQLRHQSEQLTNQGQLSMQAKADNEQLRHLRSHVEQLTKQANEYSERDGAHAGEVQQLQEALKKQYEEVESLKKLLDERSETGNDRDAAELAQLRQDVQLQATERDSLNSQISELEDDNSAKATEIAHLRRSNDELNVDAESFESQVSELEKSKNDQAEDLKAQISDLEEVTTGHHKRMAKFREDLKSRDEQIESLQTQMNERPVAEKDQNDPEIAQLRQSVQQHETERDSLNKRISELETVKSHHDSVVSKLRDSLKSRCNDVKDLRQQLNERPVVDGETDASELVQLRESIQQQAEEKEALDKKISELTSAHGNHAEETARLREDLERKVSEKESLDGEVSKLTKSRDQNAKEVKELNKKLTQQTRQLSEQARQHSTDDRLHTRDNDALRESVKALTKERDEFKQSYEARAANFEELHQKSLKRSENDRQQSSKIEDLRKQVKAITKERDGVIEEHDGTKQSCEEQAAQIETLTKKADSLSASLQKTNQAIKELEGVKERQRKIIDFQKKYVPKPFSGPADVSPFAAGRSSSDSRRSSETEGQRSPFSQALHEFDFRNAALATTRRTSTSTIATGVSTGHQTTPSSTLATGVDTGVQTDLAPTPAAPAPAEPTIIRQYIVRTANGTLQESTNVWKWLLFFLLGLVLMTVLGSVLRIDGSFRSATLNGSRYGFETDFGFMDVGPMLWYGTGGMGLGRGTFG